MIDRFVKDSKRIVRARKALSSLSDFMGCLKQSVAREANRRDGAIDNFWAGRFHSVRLQDQAQVLASSAYVNLQLIRAERATSVSESEYTSAYVSHVESFAFIMPIAAYYKSAMDPEKCGGWREPYVAIEQVQSVGDIAQALRPAFAGVKAGDWVDPTGKTRDVTVRLAPEARQRAADLAQLPLVVRDAQGRPSTLPLGQVAAITPSNGPARVDHLNRDRVIEVQANTSGRPLTSVITDIESGLKGIQLPPGYQITQGGDTEDQREVFGRIVIALGVAIMLGAIVTHASPVTLAQVLGVEFLDLLGSDFRAIGHRANGHLSIQSAVGNVAEGISFSHQRFHRWRRRALTGIKSPPISPVRPS